MGSSCQVNCPLTKSFVTLTPRRIEVLKFVVDDPVGGRRLRRRRLRR
jgi:hypothetical protein